MSHWLSPQSKCKILELFRGNVMINSKEKHFQGQRKLHDITCETQLLKYADEIHTAVFCYILCHHIMMSGLMQRARQLLNTCF